MNSSRKNVTFMTEMNFDQEEKELLESYERGEWQPVAGEEAEKERYQACATPTFKKDRRVNIRISSKDLEALQTRALEEGIPYQTLMASVLHKYVSGKMVEKTG
jgi:predicted DNA binding CopG/RHH family protein